MIEATEAFELFSVAESGGVEGVAKDAEGLVVGLERDGEGVAAFSAMGEGETGGIGEAGQAGASEGGCHSIVSRTSSVVTPSKFVLAFLARTP